MTIPHNTCLSLTKRNPSKYIKMARQRKGKETKRTEMKTMKERFKKAAKRIPKDDDTEREN